MLVSNRTRSEQIAVSVTHLKRKRLNALRKRGSCVKLTVAERNDGAAARCILLRYALCVVFGERAGRVLPWALKDNLWFADAIRLFLMRRGLINKLQLLNAVLAWSQALQLCLAVDLRGPRPPVQNKYEPTRAEYNVKHEQNLQPKQSSRGRR